MSSNICCHKTPQSFLLKESWHEIEITATIKNNGTEDGKAVNWSIEVEGTLLTRKNVETNGSVEIDAGEEEDAEGVGSATIFSFGRITVTVIAEADEGEYGYDTKVVEGWIIGPFVRIKPE